MDYPSPSLRAQQAQMQNGSDRNNGRRTILLSHATSVTNLNPMTFTADRKLHEQFNFFKQEFIKTAIRMDLAIPLDIVEEKSHFLRPFLESNGPKYVFQVLQSHITEMQILRPGLSLLVTTLALLKRHMPKNLFANEANFGFYNDKNPLTADELWATQMVPKITDSVTITGCVSILLATHHPVIQELIVNLIAGLLTVSDDAITQMLHTPNILYTQTNKKIPSTESNREKILSHQFKKIQNRLSPGQFSAVPSGLTTLPSSNKMEDSRRNSSPTPTELHRYSFRATDRSNSRINTGNRASNDSSLNDNGRNDDPDEFSSCLAYIFSVVLMQRNRHLLLAGCADIIIAMARNSSSSILCEYIAKVPTSPLPIIDFSKNANGNRGHSLKHLYTNQQQVIEPLHVNPLGSKVVEWAGIRIPLKFLQRYHQIFGTTSNQNRNLSSAPASNHPGSSQSSNRPQDVVHDNVKNEYRYAHNRALLAICSLLVSSHDIVSYVVGLQGAIEVIKLSASIYAEDELHSRGLGSAGNMGSIDSFGGSSKPGSRRSNEAHPNLPTVISTALNSLILEKQHQNRLKAMMNHNSQTSDKGFSSAGNSRRSSVSLSINEAGNPIPAPAGSPLPARKVSTSPGKIKGPNQKLKPLSSQSNTRSAPALDFNNTMAKGSRPVTEHLTQSVPLSSQYEIPFDANYSKETEKYQLYIQNQNTAKAIEKGLASPLQFYAAKQITQQNRGPLQANVLSRPDAVLNNSLQVIDASIQDSLLQPVKPVDRTPISSLMFSQNLNQGSRGSSNNNENNLMQNSQFLPSNSISLLKTESNTLSNVNNNEQDEIGDRRLLKSAPVSPFNHGMSATRDFFGILPVKPDLPHRIEARDVIVPNEPISKIRKKFQILGENAVNQIKQSGKSI
jgi:hypothetical protein